MTGAACLRGCSRLRDMGLGSLMLGSWPVLRWCGREYDFKALVKIWNSFNDLGHCCSCWLGLSFLSCSSRYSVLGGRYVVYNVLGATSSAASPQIEGSRGTSVRSKNPSSSRKRPHPSRLCHLLQKSL